MVAIKRAIEPEIQEKAEALGMSRQWVTKYDEQVYENIQKNVEMPRRGIQSNVWGLENGQITSPAFVFI